MSAVPAAALCGVSPSWLPPPCYLPGARGSRLCQAPAELLSCENQKKAFLKLFWGLGEGDLLFLDLVFFLMVLIVFLVFER